MHIGFDAKRAFNNTSGLGNYSRNLLTALKKYYPENDYILYTSKINSSLFSNTTGNYTVRTPSKKIYKTFSSCWRTFELSKESKKDNLDIFHGLSHELPVKIEKTGIKTVVTIHDLIFLRYPHLYSGIDKYIYNKKFYSACKRADAIIAVSNQTANDIKEFYKIPSDKIEVIHQGVNSIFYTKLNDEDKQALIKKYNLPSQFILYVGTIEERKNLLTLVKALYYGKIDLPLVAVGRPTRYFKKVTDFIRKNSVTNCCFIESVNNTDLPGFYQCSSLFVYPSVYEGFGIPILEALFSKVPVITSKGGVFSEAGGSSTHYVDPNNYEELAAAIKKIVNDSALKLKMIEEGYNHALNFSDKAVSDKTMNIYKSLRVK